MTHSRIADMAAELRAATNDPIVLAIVSTYAKESDAEELDMQHSLLIMELENTRSSAEWFAKEAKRGTPLKEVSTKAVALINEALLSDAPEGILAVLDTKDFAYESLDVTVAKFRPRISALSKR